MQIAPSHKEQIQQIYWPHPPALSGPFTATPLLKPVQSRKKTPMMPVLIPFCVNVARLNDLSDVN